MVTANEYFSKLEGAYLFSEIGKRVAAFSKENPEKPLIRMGIGDVTRPLVPAVIEAMQAAVRDMSAPETFKGYGPDQGYAFLREKIAANDYAPRGVTIEPDEIFISDGIKSDMGNVGDILASGNVVAVTDPVYPVYVDSNIMAGREIRYVKGTPENGFAPPPPDFDADILYLCSPNNPTGSVMARDKLAAWVDYAIKHKALILFDAAYESFISDSSVPHSIYEIEGAKDVAIEFCSYSKRAGFTGVRCGYTIVPKQLTVGGVLLHPLWYRRQTTKYNGTPYITQRAAEAVYTPEGREQNRQTVAYYMENARVIRESLSKYGVEYIGGLNAPYIWLKCPGGLSSWDFFDKLLNEAGIVGTPGVGFGPAGEGWFRLTAFNNLENTQKAMERFGKIL